MAVRMRPPAFDARRRKGRCWLVSGRPQQCESTCVPISLFASSSPVVGHERQRTEHGDDPTDRPREPIWAYIHIPKQLHRFHRSYSSWVTQTSSWKKSTLLCLKASKAEFISTCRKL